MTVFPERARFYVPRSQQRCGPSGHGVVQRAPDVSAVGFGIDGDPSLSVRARPHEDVPPPASLENPGPTIVIVTTWPSRDPWGTACGEGAGPTPNSNEAGDWKLRIRLARDLVVLGDSDRRRGALRAGIELREVGLTYMPAGNPRALRRGRPGRRAGKHRGTGSIGCRAGSAVVLNNWFPPGQLATPVPTRSQPSLGVHPPSLDPDRCTRLDSYDWRP